LAQFYFISFFYYSLPFLRRFLFAVSVIDPDDDSTKGDA